jgi:SAM-dependent methyltransferase
MLGRRMSCWLFHRLCYSRTDPPVYDDERFRSRYLGYDVDSTGRFFARFRPPLALEGRSVLDVGCGRGAVCVESVHRGAKQVVGVDLAIARQVRELVAGDSELSRHIRFVETDGSLRELGSERFDLVLSKDSFEHYADPEAMALTIARLVRPGGQLAIGFGPLWRSPYGGHIEYMSPVPWVHLAFAEDVIMAERRRFRPNEDAASFAEIRGGLNRMTLGRFQSIMATTGLDCLRLDTNVSEHPAVRAMSVLSRLPGLREPLTVSVYGVWRKPSAAA